MLLLLLALVLSRRGEERRELVWIVDCVVWCVASERMKVDGCIGLLWCVDEMDVV